MKRPLAGFLSALSLLLVTVSAQAATIFAVDNGAAFSAFGITHTLSFELDVPFGGSCALCAVTGLAYANSNGGSGTPADLIPNPPAFGSLLDVANGAIVPDPNKAFFWADNAGGFWGFADFIPGDGEFDFLRCSDGTCTGGDTESLSLARLSSVSSSVPEPSAVLLIAAALAAMGFGGRFGRTGS